jgi:hypothetical protein
LKPKGSRRSANLAEEWAPICDRRKATLSVAAGDRDIRFSGKSLLTVTIHVSNIFAGHGGGNKMALVCHLATFQA